MGKYSYDRDWKLRVVVDASLSPGQQLAQTLHAAIEYTQQHPEMTQRWHDLSNSVVCLVSDDLPKLMSRAVARGVGFSVFREPDMDNHLTAVALEPCANARRLTSDLKLALRGL